MEKNEAPIPRHAARVLLIDEADQVLLVRFEDPDSREIWWAAPGGGLERGETHEDAARREIREETGLEKVELGSWIWSRRHVFRLGGILYHQHERYFLTRVASFRPRVLHLERDEAQAFRDLRWWSPAELAASGDRLVPADLSALLCDLLAHGPPVQPLDVGI